MPTYPGTGCWTGFQPRFCSVSRKFETIARRVLWRSRVGRPPRFSNCRQRADLHLAADLLRHAQPSMAPLARLAQELLRSNHPARTGRDFLAALDDSNGLIARSAEPLLADGAVVLTHSASSTVMEALAFAHRQGKALRVLAAESNPGGEGRAVVTELSRAGVTAELISDHAVPSALEEADLALTGADWISLTAVTNKVGTAALCRAAQHRAKTGLLPLFAAENPTVRTAARSHGPVRTNSHRGILLRS